MEKQFLYNLFPILEAEVKFNNLQDLIDQMKVDEEQALAIWLMHNKGFSWILKKLVNK